MTPLTDDQLAAIEGRLARETAFPATARLSIFQTHALTDTRALLDTVREQRAALQAAWKLSIMELSVSSRLEVAAAGDKIQALLAPVLYPEVPGGETSINKTDSRG